MSADKRDRTVRARWRDFERMLIKAGVSRSTRRDLRGVFYAGASSMLALMLETFDDDSLENGQVGDQVQKFSDEVHRFNRRLGRSIGAEPQPEERTVIH